MWFYSFSVPSNVSCDGLCFRARWINSLRRPTWLWLSGQTAGGSSLLRPSRSAPVWAPPEPNRSGRKHRLHYWLPKNNLQTIESVLTFVSFHQVMMMKMNVARESCPPVLITSCTSSLCSGSFYLPLFLLPTTGMAGPASSCPSLWSACWRQWSETWRRILAVLSASKTPWLLWCLWLWVLQYQVRHRLV